MRTELRTPGAATPLKTVRKLPVGSKVVRAKKRSVRVVPIEQDASIAISEWHHFVIKQLVTSPGFKDDARWISRKLRGKITPRQAREAVDRLLRIGLLEREVETRRLRPTVSSAFTEVQVPPAAIREHHAQMIERAREAVLDQEPANREHGSLTMIFDKDRIEEAKAAIREFRSRFTEEFLVATPRAQSVYQFNLQFFEHTCDDPRPSTTLT